MTPCFNNTLDYQWLPVWPECVLGCSVWVHLHGNTVAFQICAIGSKWHHLGLDCQECFQNSTLSTNFPNFVTYELLSYFVDFICANNFTPFAFSIIFSNEFRQSRHVSQTQTLITQISRLCQEICDIKRQNKNQSNSTPKTEPREGVTLTWIQEETMDSNQCQDHTNIDGTDGSSCTYSSHICQGHSTQCSQRDKCLFCGQTSPTSHCQ